MNYSINAAHARVMFSAQNFPAGRFSSYFVRYSNRIFKSYPGFLKLSTSILWQVNLGPKTYCVRDSPAIELDFAHILIKSL